MFIIPALESLNLNLIRTAQNSVVAISKSQNSDGEEIIEGQDPHKNPSLVQRHLKPRLGIERKGH